MNADPIGSTSAAGAGPRAAPPESATPEAARPSADGPTEQAQGLLSLRLLMADLQATLLALAALARSELQLSMALLLRAGILAAVGLLILGLAVILACALLVAVSLALGLSWPAALASSLVVLLLASWMCWYKAARHLRECGLPRTRSQLAALWPENSP